MGPEHDEWRDEVGVSAPATDEYWARVGGRTVQPPHLRKRNRQRGGVVAVDAVAGADRGVQND